MSKLTLKTLCDLNNKFAPTRTPVSKHKAPLKSSSAPHPFLAPLAKPSVHVTNLYPHPPAPSPEDVEAACPALRALIETGGETEEAWSLGIINIAKFTANPEEAVQAWSSEYFEYDAVEVQAKLTTKQKGASKPTGCTRMADLSPACAEACETCSFQGKVSGPVHAAQKYAVNKTRLISSVTPSDSSPLQEVSILDFTDAGNAAWLHNCFNGSVRFVTEQRSWIVFAAGTGWSEQSEAQILRLAELAIREMGSLAMTQLSPDHLKKLSSHISRSLSASGLASAVALLKGQPNIEVHARLLDADPMMLGLGNGEGYDLRRRTVFDLKPDHLITKSVCCVYDPSAQCPLWDEFLSEVFEHQRELIAYLQTWVGYCLTGMITEQQALFAFGIGANGKSVLFSVLAEMFGSYAVSAPVETFMLSAGEGPKSYLLARLAGARFVLANETADGQRLAENTIKELTGGERIAAAHKYGHVFEYQPSFKIAIVGNHKPTIRGTDSGIWRRLHLLPFNRTFELAEQDTQLVFKLKAELPGILNWALHGLALWQQRGRLLVPEGMKDELKTYQAESDVIGLWLNEQCETGDTLEASSASLYQSYKHWCESNGHRASSQTMLGRRLFERGFRKRSGARIVWIGLAVRPLFSV